VLGLNILVPVGTAITLIPFFQWDIVSAYVLFTIALAVRSPIVPTCSASEPTGGYFRIENQELLHSGTQGRFS
jgi:hypothetical protein